MELINELDENRKGYIDLAYFAGKVDQLINKDEFKLVLKSKVQLVVEEEIVEQVDEIKNLGTASQSRKAQKPKSYNSTMLDIAVGLKMQNNDEFVDFFSGLARTRRDGKINIGEFEKGINNYLNCDVDRDDSYALFNYILNKQIKAK